MNYHAAQAASTVDARLPAHPPRPPGSVPRPAAAKRAPL